MLKFPILFVMSTLLVVLVGNQPALYHVISTLWCASQYFKYCTGLYTGQGSETVYFSTGTVSDTVLKKLFKY